MPSRERFFHPFDVTYGEVSRRTRQMLEVLNAQDEERWLRAVIWDFQVEADRWDRKPELAHYRTNMEKLPLKILRLAGAAYLHICYDLPRVLADHWPGTLPNNPPSLARGHQIYAAIGQFFPEVIDEVGIMPEVVGVSGPLLQWQKTKRVMRLWIVDLRGTAWMHGQVLQQLLPDRRSTVEQAMCDVLTEALDQVSGWAPWDILDLLPPDEAFERSGVRLYEIALPFIPIDIFGSQVMVPLEWLTLLISLATLGFVFIQQTDLQQQKGLQEKHLTVSKRSLSPEEIDDMIAEVIERLGHNIKVGMEKLFSEIELPSRPRSNN